MHVGSIVHEIVQRSLRCNLTTLKEIRKVAEELLRSPDIIHLLYSSRLSLEQISCEIEPFLMRIHEFMRQYIVGDLDCVASKDQNVKPYTGRINEIQDIEENVWSPRLGLKGKIDVTVKVHAPKKFFDSFQKTVPLEIKTGRASFSLEHKGQLILYQMMMQDLGKNIESGLLLYIRDGLMCEFTAPQSERRGLMQMRNRLAHYLSLDLVTSNKESNLPEPINHHSACGRCEYNTVCCTFLQNEKDVKLAPDHPLMKVKEKVASHLSQAHIDYFLHWCHIITLEQNESQKSMKLRHIWTKEPSVRAAKGSALINLKIKDLVQPQEDDYIHHFGSSTDETFDFTATSFEVGEYLIVSTDKRCSVAAGRVTKIESSVITLALLRDLSVQYNNCHFHIDRYESSSQSVFNFSNIAALLNNSDRSNLLRKTIIEKCSATFSKTLSKNVLQLGEKILSRMNPVQRKAVLKAMTCENYMLIKGLPGTGKTQTLVQLIKLLLIMKKTVLITSHTNAAVDNILLRLKEQRIDFMRLGSASRTNSELRDHLECSLVSNCKSVEDLKKVYNQYQIVAVTCLGSSHALLSERNFDYCLVDESTQILQATVIRPLLSADKFILVGDPEQLAPLVKSSCGRMLGADESLFQRLDTPESTMVLGLQYRMNRVITKLANSLTYEGQLQCANDKVEMATMHVPNEELLKEKLKTEKWLVKALSTHIDQSCSLINTGDVFEISSEFAESVKDDSSKAYSTKTKLYVNFCEIAIVLHIVDLLMSCGVPGSSIGVIAPYRNQVETLRKILSHHSSVEVNTVDQYQGRDKSIIIYSCTQFKMRSSEAPRNSEVEILEDRRRLTVAITRSKHKLIMIGNVTCLNDFTPFEDLFKHINAVSKFTLEKDKFGFTWQMLLAEVKNKI